MSIIGRRVSSAVLESGELVSVLSEHTQMNRDPMTLYEPGTSRIRYRVYDTPWSRERILWSGVTKEGQYPYNPAFLPVLVRLVQASGAEPARLRYLRNPIHPEIQYNWTTGELMVFWWENRYSPYPSDLKGLYRLKIKFKEKQFSITMQGLSFDPQDPESNKTTLQQAVRNALIEQGFTLPVEVSDENEFSYKISISSSILSFEDFTPENQQLGLNLTREGSETVRVSFAEDITEYGLTLNLKLSSFEIELDDIVFDSQKIESNISFLTQLFKSKVEPLGYTGPVDVFSISSLVYIVQCGLPFDSVVAEVQELAGTIVVELLNDNQFQLAFVKNLDPALVSPIRDIPILSGISLPETEPHSTLNTIPGAKTHDTGDPNEFAGPAIYNHFRFGATLGVGGVAEAKNVNPIDESSIARALPVSPGLIDYSVITAIGERISLSAIENEIQTHTSHLYHQRELQDLGLATRVLMYSRGFIEDLDIEATSPPVGNEQSGLKIGAGYLLPGQHGEYYRGSLSVTVHDSEVSFGGISLGERSAAFFFLTVGETGQILLASGGVPPYTWSLRTIASVLDGTPTVIDGYSDPFASTTFVFSDYNSYEKGGLPKGLFLNKSGFLFGRPAEVGVFVFRVQVQDSAGHIGEQSLMMDVTTDGEEWQCKPELHNDMEITTPGELGSLLPGQEESFKVQLHAINGAPPYSWSAPGDNLSGSSILTRLGGHVPPGLTVSTSGTITLAPGTIENNPGLWLFQVRAMGTDGKCVRKVFTLALNTQLSEGTSIGATALQPPEALPQRVKRSLLILQAPRIVNAFVQGANTVARGPEPQSIGGLETPNVRPGTVQSLLPGIIMGAGALRTTQQAYSPSVGILDWIPSNPHDFFSSNNDWLEAVQSPVETTVDNPLNADEVQEFRFSPDKFKIPLVGVYQVSLGGNTYNAITFDSETPEVNVDPLRVALKSIAPDYVTAVTVTPLNRLTYSAVFKLKPGTKWVSGLYQAEGGTAFNGTVSVVETTRGQNLGAVTLEQATISDIASVGRKLRPLWPV